jgi:hypothetical protein
MVALNIIIVVNIAQNESISMTFKGHAVLPINVSLDNSGSALYRMAPQLRVAEIGIKKGECLVYLLLCRLGEPGILFNKPLR